MTNSNCCHGNLPGCSIHVARAFIVPEPIYVRAARRVGILQSLTDNNSAVQEYKFERLVWLPLCICSNSLARDDLFPRNPLSQFGPCRCLEIFKIRVHHCARFALHDLEQSFLSAASSFSRSASSARSEEHTSELQSQSNLVCRLLLEKKK